MDVNLVPSRPDLPERELFLTVDVYKRQLISIYREGETKGTFVDNGNGELAFTSDDGSVKGTIKINGWDGVSFKVTEPVQSTILSDGISADTGETRQHDSRNRRQNH